VSNNSGTLLLEAEANGEQNPRQTQENWGKTNVQQNRKHNNTG